MRMTGHALMALAATVLLSPGAARAAESGLPRSNIDEATTMQVIPLSRNERSRRVMATSGLKHPQGESNPRSRTENPMS